MTEIDYIDKEKVIELLEKLGHRVIDVPGEHSCYGAIVIIHGQEEDILRYVNEENLQ
jgi:Fe-S oxidoreductase